MGITMTIISSQPTAPMSLMVVFVMQTLILPLVFLWALLKVAGGVLLARPAPRRTLMPST